MGTRTFAKGGGRSAREHDIEESNYRLRLQAGGCAGAGAEQRYADGACSRVLKGTEVVRMKSMDLRRHERGAEAKRRNCEFVCRLWKSVERVEKLTERTGNKRALEERVREQDVGWAGV